MALLKQDARIIFLAAGRGSRLHPYTADRPKWALDVGGQSILERMIGCAHACGLTDVVVVRGSAGGKVRCPSVTYVEDQANQNMIHSLLAAREFIHGEVIVSYADILYEPRVLDSIMMSQASISVVVDLDWQRYFATRAQDARDIAESLRLAGSTITSIGQPLQVGELPQAQYVGLIKVDAEGAQLLQDVYDELLVQYGGKPWRNAKTFERAYMTDFLQELIDRGVPVHAVPIRSGWMEFDSPRDYENALAWVRSGTLAQFVRIDQLPNNASVVSAGGVVLRSESSETEVLLVGDGSPNGWRLPKGMQEPGEPITVAALREVREETGMEGEIVGYVGRAEWSYAYDSVDWDELVHFFLMRAVSNSTLKRDEEYAGVSWMKVGAADVGMKFESERQILRTAVRQIRERSSRR